MKIKDTFESISENQLVDLENQLGKPLPNDYKSFLLKNNGGRPEPNFFRTLSGDYETDIQFFYGITKGIYSIQDNLFQLKSRLPKGKVAIANDSGGNYILLDINTNQIFFFDHEIEEVFFVSESFTDFVNSLFNVDQGESELDRAIESQNIEFFKSILSSGTDINNITNEFDQSAFIAICLRGKLKLARFFVENGVSIGGGLFASSSNGHVNLVEYLLQKGANPNERDATQNNDTALIQASMGGYLKVVKQLISKGADINATDDHGQTALNKSYWSDNQELIDYLEKEVY
ncbi:SMI1/KNR4 family protein [Reichenbachiella agarivorans]|uniref:SMI1/KNR4 family protein n=1 Tax=Reichenbachiella agarivorans TaxID=2979464 RepID=A0ABY6CTM7_9BACT|nr:ankyrin repeat domain-containing protein [Reichenbachiella agarivorans]UXP33872.1 SMI1/KNR4 family protein [Reichenbachiella agarivorans]